VIATEPVPGNTPAVRIHLGHHFYGAGNLGDDFMLAGFLSAMRSLAPAATFTCCVPFDLTPLRKRFPEIEWHSYDEHARAQGIERCDTWLGLGGSPFQCALSRWFIDHLVTEAALCTRARKPMFFLGVGVQSPDELTMPDTRRVCAQAAGIWTRDAASADRISALPSPPPVATGADLAHLFFRDVPPPPAKAGRVTLVANFDYHGWPGQSAFLHALQSLPASEHIWLAQESRELPGAERALHAALPPAEQSRWRLISPERAGAPLSDVMARWPSGEWLATARYHTALAGAWSGSKTVVLGTNEKLRSAARDLQVPEVAPGADEKAVMSALSRATPAVAPHSLAGQAHDACSAFIRSAVAHQR
jgi:hypothetical protein